MIPRAKSKPDPAGMLSAKGRNEESGVATKVTLGLNFFWRSVNVAVGVDEGEFAGIGLVTHPDKINVKTNMETTITIRLAIKDGMAFQAETVTGGPTLFSFAHCEIIPCMAVL